MFSVKTDDCGIVIEDLQEKFLEHFSENPETCSPPVRALLYMIPTYQNPTGSILPDGEYLTLSLLKLFCFTSDS